MGLRGRDRSCSWRSKQGYNLPVRHRFDRRDHTTPESDERQRTPDCHQAHRRARLRGRALRRRFRRRDAARRGPAHQHLGAGRQRRRHVPGLPGRDPRPERNARRGVRIPGPLRRARHLHAGRHGRRPGRHEPRRARREPPVPPAPGHPHRRRGRVRRERPEARPRQVEPARGRQPGRVQRHPGPPHVPHPRGGRGPRGRAQARHPLPELLRDGPHLLALRARPGADAALGAKALSRSARGAGCRHQGVAHRLELRRDHRGAGAQLPRATRRARARRVPQHHRQPGTRLRPDRGVRAFRKAAVLRLVPHHSRQRHPPRARPAQALRRAHVPGRGRDRRR